MLRAIVLCGLISIGCAGVPGEVTGVSEQATEVDGGVEPDAGPDPEPCNWFVYWLTHVRHREPCTWGMRSKDPAVALFRANGSECLAPATICGIPACADITYVRELQIIEVWGPAGLDAGDVWAATESFDCVE